MMKMSELSEAKRDARTERGRQSPLGMKIESQVTVDWGERSIASGGSVRRFLAKALKRKEEFEQQPKEPPEQFPATVNETQERFHRECDEDHERAYELFRKKLREFPEACFPKKKEVPVADETGKKGLGGSPAPVAKIDKEMIIENGRQLEMRKPNADKLRDPFFNKPRFGESDPLAPIKGLKGKKTTRNLDAQLRRLTQDEIKKLPGQDSAFPGRPILKDYYHQIIPTKSEADAESLAGAVANLAGGAKKKGRNKQVSKTAVGSQSTPGISQATPAPATIKNLEWFKEKFTSPEQQAELTNVKPGARMNIRNIEKGGEDYKPLRQDGSLKNVISRKQFDEQFSQTYDQKKQEVLKSYLQSNERLQDGQRDEGRTLMPE